MSDRLMLSEGYSMLYKDASNLDLTELILYVKVESEAMDKDERLAASDRPYKRIARLLAR